MSCGTLPAPEKAFRLALLSLVISVISPALAAPVWCEGGEETLGDHPLSLQMLREEAGDISHRQGMISLVAERFEEQQEKVDSSSNEIDSDFLRKFRQLLDSHDGHVDFRFTLRGNGTRAYIARTESPTIELGCDLSPAKLYEAHPTRVHIGLAAHAIFHLGSELLNGQFELPSQSISSLSRSYENWLLKDGLAQWPWELAVNGWKHRNDPYNAPAPRSQIVFMRPNAGLEFQWSSQEEATVDASVGIEPIGMVWYRGGPQEYNRWWGVSALVTVGTNDQGAGIGGLLRYNNYWLGVTDRQGEDGLYIFIGIDLHKYLKGKDGLKADVQNWLDAHN